jgi:two-component system chemotaxis response regulator CheB
MIKILVVDDSALMRRLIGAALKVEGDLAVEFARDGVEALERLKDFKPDVITLDVHMPQMDGLACLDRIMIERPTPVVMVSSLTEAGAGATLEAISLGAVDFVAKPAGAISLVMDEFAPVLIEKIRAAAKARINPALRLTERVRLRAGGTALPVARRSETERRPTLRTEVSAGDSARRLAPPRIDSVVLVGASTGGPPALDALLAVLPADFPWPILVAQHMPASFTGPLSRRLDRLCALTVAEVTEPQPLRPGMVYIGKGDADIIVSTRGAAAIVMAAPSMAEYRWHPSVDRLVSTAMQHLAASRLIGVLMTGMGNDGAQAMKRLRDEGGRTIAEAEETAVVWGMPGELVRAGGADVVLPLSAIPTQLLEWSA